MKEALQNETSTDMIVEGKIIRRIETHIKTKHARGCFSKKKVISHQRRLFVNLFRDDQSNTGELFGDDQYNPRDLFRDDQSNLRELFRDDKFDPRELI